MANLLISWTDSRNKYVYFDESHYLRYEHHADFDMGTSDFSLGLIFYCDSTVGYKGTYKTLIAKGPYAIDSDTGYMLRYDATNEKLVFHINDGDVASPFADTQNQSVLDDTFHYIWVNVDRNVGTTIYKDGSALTNNSDNTTNAANTINAAEPITIGSHNVVNTYLKGYISSVYVCKDYLPSATWIQNWYYRMKYLHPVTPPRQYCTIWDFSESLRGKRLTSEKIYAYHEGVWNPSGAPTYATSGISYDFASNFGYGFERGYLPLDTVVRAIDGTAKIYQGGTKQRLFLTFVSNSVEQRYFVEGAYLCREPLNVYLEGSGTERTFQGYLVAPPNIIETYTNIFEYELELEEI